VDAHSSAKRDPPGDDHRSAALFPDPAPDQQPEILRRANISKAKKGIFLQLEALNQIRQSLPSLEINNVEYDETQNQLTLNVKSMDKQTLQDFVARSAETFEFTMQPISGEAPYTAIITGSYK
jgi:hypothetical protein